MRSWHINWSICVLALITVLSFLSEVFVTYQISLARWTIIVNFVSYIWCLSIGVAVFGVKIQRRCISTRSRVHWDIEWIMPSIMLWKLPGKHSLTFNKSYLSVSFTLEDSLTKGLNRFPHPSITFFCVVDVDGSSRISAINASVDSATPHSVPQMPVITSSENFSIESITFLSIGLWTTTDVPPYVHQHL